MVKTIYQNIQLINLVKSTLKIFFSSAEFNVKNYFNISFQSQMYVRVYFQQLFTIKQIN